MKIRLLAEYMGHKAGTVVEWNDRLCQRLIKDKHAECVSECGADCVCENKAVTADKPKPRTKVIGGD